MNKKLPLYKATIKDDNDGMYCISLVDYPAVEVDWLAFNDDNRKLEFEIQDEDQHIIRGVIMRADFPIYRRTSTGFEYYIQYDKETIRKMAEKYLKDDLQNNVDTQHNDKLEDGVNLVQWFIKDTDNGINPKGFEDIEEGSLFAEFKVNNEDIWKEIKDGTFKGFSLAGYFGVEEIEDPEEKEYNDIIDLLNKISKKLK